jgi:thioredoxin 1
MAGNNTRTLTDANFTESVIQSQVPVLVDFWAEWCAPCRMIAPTVEQVASDYSGRVTVGKLNVDEHPGIAEQFGIRSIPTLLLFKAGDVVETVIGVTDKPRLTALIDRHL